MTDATPQLEELTAEQVQRRLARYEIVLVDVREPNEYFAERIPGALLLPLSCFDPQALPVSEDRPVVLHCGSGKRSATAVNLCLNVGVSVTAHLKGGIDAWKAASLPVITPG